MAIVPSLTTLAWLRSWKLDRWMLHFQHRPPCFPTGTDAAKNTSRYLHVLRSPWVLEGFMNAWRNESDMTRSGWLYVIINLYKRQNTLSTPSLHTRSPFLPSPPTLAPTTIDSHTSSDLRHPSNKETTKSDTNLSRPTSSTFSARWMSNLLKTSSSSGIHHHQPRHRATPTLESIFSVNADMASSSSLHPLSGTSLATA